MFSGLVKKLRDNAGAISFTTIGLIGIACASGPVVRQADGDIWWQQEPKPHPYSFLGAGGQNAEWEQERRIMLDMIRRRTAIANDTSTNYEYSKKAALEDGKIDSSEARALMPLLEEAYSAQQSLREYALGIQPRIISSQQVEFYELKIRKPEMLMDSYQADHKKIAPLAR